MQNAFFSITAAGMLLPVDLLKRVNSMDRSIPVHRHDNYNTNGIT